MGKDIHPILKRYLTKYWKEKPIDDEMNQLLEAVGQSFEYFERDRELLQRAMELSSEELSEANVKIRDDSQRKFENIFNYSSIGMAVTNLEGRLIDMNNQMSVITGYTREELQAKGVWDLNHPDDNAKNKELFQKLVGGEVNSYVHEKRYIHKAGRIVHVVVTASLFVDPQTKQQQIIAQIQDVSELVNERMLRLEQENKYKVLIENALIGVGIVKDEKIIYGNPTLAKMLGYESRAEYESENTDIVYGRATEATRQKLIERIEAIRRGEKVSDSFTGSFTTKQGEEKIFEIFSRPIYLDGELCRMSIIIDITEKHLVSNALLEERHRFSEIITAIEVGTWEWNIETGEIALNERWAASLGYSLDELVPMTIEKCRELTHPEDLEGCERLIKEHLDGKSERFQSEIRFRHKDGSWRWVLNRAKVVKWSNRGEPLMMYGAQFEITREVEVRKSLEEINAIFEFAQSIANLGTWRWKIDEDVVSWSDSIIKIFEGGEVRNGFSYEEYMQLIHADDRDKVRSAYQAAIDDHSTFQVEHRVILNNGQVKWLLAKGGLVHTDFNSREINGILRDITKEKEIEEELRTSWERYQLLADSGQEIISLLNLDGTYAYCSPALMNLSGYDPVDFVKRGVTVWDVAYIMDVEALNDAFEASIANPGKTYSARARFQDVKGVYRWYEKSFKAVTNEAGRVLYVRSLKQDISKQLEYEQKLKDTNAVLEESLEKLRVASEAKENFLSIMSHEIRTPLNSVIGLSNLLLRRNPREDQYEIIKTLKNSSDNLMHLVNDILDYNKIQAGKVELEFITFRLSQFLNHLHNSFKQLAEDRNLELKTKLDPQIPDILIGDVTRLNQIFTNLINNAIKFTRQGSVTIEASMRSLTDTNCAVAFEVKDTGIGIASDKFETIFQPFQQSEANVSRQFGGTGLGLSIVKNLVQMFGGGLSVESTKGEGSVFTVVIDFKISHYIGDSEMSIQKPKESARKLNVLYVEDVESNRFLVQNLLEDNGMQCHLAISGEDALKKTNDAKFDLILMDIQMPGMDGYATSEKIRHQAEGKNLETPIIAFTAEPFSEKLKNKVLSHKIQDVITKPFEIDAFVEKINLISSKNGVAVDEITLGFYERAFNGDKGKLNHIKGAVIDDVTVFINNFSEAEKRHSIAEMRAEIHRIRPIMKNIGALQLVSLLDQFRLHEDYSEELMHMSSTVKKQVEAAIDEIGKINYE